MTRPSPGCRKGERLSRAQQLATQQREGILEVRSSSVQKRDLRRQMRRGQLTHLAGVADIASKELPELAQKFILAPVTSPYLAFRTAARGMAAEARGTDGRREHVGASAELDTVGDELVQIVRVMDGLNRVRFANDSASLAAWESASNTVGPARSSGIKPAPGPSEPPSSGGEVKPAA